MFYHLQYIHLFRPFLKYSPSASPLPPHISPRRICTANAGFISKLMRLYKKLYNLRQICNIAVYMLHSACTIHLLNLPEKTARRDIIHGVKHLEEIAEDWLCARRTLSILSVLARKWNCELPDEAAATLKRTDEKYGHLGTAEVPSPNGLIPYTPSPPAFVQSPAPSQTVGRETLPDNLVSTVGSIPTTENIQHLDMPTPITQEAPSSSMAFARSNNPWAMSGIGQPAMPRYYQTYTAVGQPSGGEQTRGSAGSRQYGTSNTPYTLDGKDWFLKDSVNLQQNFESWNMGTTAAGSSTSTNANTNTLPGGDVFMFKGLQGSDLDLGDGWDFDSSMTNLDMISGLD